MSQKSWQRLAAVLIFPALLLKYDMLIFILSRFSLEAQWFQVFPCFELTLFKQVILPFVFICLIMKNASSFMTNPAMSKGIFLLKITAVCLIFVATDIFVFDHLIMNNNMFVGTLDVLGNDLVFAIGTWLRLAWVLVIVAVCSPFFLVKNHRSAAYTIYVILGLCFVTFLDCSGWRFWVYFFGERSFYGTPMFWIFLCDWLLLFCFFFFLAERIGHLEKGKTFSFVLLSIIPWALISIDLIFTVFLPSEPLVVHMFNLFFYEYFVLGAIILIPLIFLLKFFTLLFPVICQFAKRKRKERNHHLQPQSE